MHSRTNLGTPGGLSGAPLPRFHPTALRVAAAAVFLIAAFTGKAQNQLPQPPGGQLRADKINLPTPINQPPDANAQLEEREHLIKTQDFAAANAERRKQIADDSAKLVKLAADLKAEIEKTSKDTLSLGVIRKADEIERLARGVKEKMKLIAGAHSF